MCLSCSNVPFLQFRNIKTAGAWRVGNDNLPRTRSFGWVQKRHMDLADNLQRLEEQEKASTQLGRLYSEQFKDTQDLLKLREAEFYTDKALAIAKEMLSSSQQKHTCKAERQKVLAVAYCNRGLLFLDLEDFRSAEEYLRLSLQVLV